MKSKTKNLKILALILLTSTLLIIGSGAASVKAATEPTVYVYNSQGGDIAANGTQLTPSTNYNYTDGDTVNYTPVPGTGFAFLCWDWLGTATPVTSTSNTLTETLSASDACAIQALFVPISNATQTATGSGSASVTTLLSAGGTTSPSGGSGSAQYTNYTIGSSASFTATASSDFKFLYWLVVSAQGRSYYTTSNIDLAIPTSAIAVQAFFVPTASTVTIPEFSSIIVAVLAVALTVSAIGTVAYKRSKK